MTGSGKRSKLGCSRKIITRKQHIAFTLFGHIDQDPYDLFRSRKHRAVIRINRHLIYILRSIGNSRLNTLMLLMHRNSLVPQRNHNRRRSMQIPLMRKLLVKRQRRLTFQLAIMLLIVGRQLTDKYSTSSFRWTRRIEKSLCLAFCWVDSIDFGERKMNFTSDSGKSSSIHYDLLLGADGRSSAVRRLLSKYDTSVKYETGLNGRS